MADIRFDFPISAPVGEVFRAIATPEGLNAWWTLDAVGQPSDGQIMNGQTWELGFGPSYAWQARVSEAEPEAAFELEMTVADGDWQGSRIGFRLEEQNGRTQVQFHHTGWLEENAHFRTSGFCWAMYLRLLKRYCESGEVVPYNMRLEA